MQDQSQKAASGVLSMNSLDWQLKRLMAQWPLAPERVKLIREEYAAVYKEVGEVRFKAAVDSVIREHAHNFFPTISSFRGHIPAKSGEFGVRCSMCRDRDGWVYVGNAVIRCRHECKSTERS